MVFKKAWDVQVITSYFLMLSNIAMSSVHATSASTKERMAEIAHQVKHLQASHSEEMSVQPSLAILLTYLVPQLWHELQILYSCRREQEKQT